MKKFVTSTLVAASLFMAACSMRITDFTVISTKNVSIPSKEKAPRVTGKDCVIVVLFPLGVVNLKEAIDKAIETAGPQYDALIDGVAYLDNFSFIFGKQCYRVEGTPINTKAGVALDDSKGTVYFHSKLDAGS